MKGKRGAGIWIAGGTGTKIIQCRSVNSSGPGFLDEGVRTELEGNISEGNGGHGFEFARGARVAGNVARGNMGAGFYERPLPRDLTEEIAEAFACGDSGESIWQKFGARLQAFGHVADTWVSLAASSLQLRSLLQAYGIPIP